MSKKKTVEPKLVRRGMTFSQTKKTTSLVSMDKFKYPFKLYEKNHNKGSLDCNFKNKVQTAISGTGQTVTIDETKIVNRKLISNPLPFRQTVAAPTKRINTRQNYAQPTCSNTLDLERNSGGNPIIYARQGTPQPTNHERSEDWLKRKDQPRNNKGQFTSPNKNAEKEVDLNLEHCIRRGIRLLQLQWQAGPHQH